MYFPFLFKSVLHPSISSLPLISFPTFLSLSSLLYSPSYQCPKSSLPYFYNVYFTYLIPIASPPISYVLSLPLQITITSINFFSSVLFLYIFYFIIIIIHLYSPLHQLSLHRSIVHQYEHNTVSKPHGGVPVPVTRVKIPFRQVHV